MRSRNDILKRRSWFAARVVAVPVLAISIIGLCVGLGALIPVNEDFEEPSDGIEIYIVSNGIHADIVLPMFSSAVDWREWLPSGDFGSYDRRAGHVAFGWGDRAIFIDTPTWADMKFSTGLKALVGMNGSVMHVTPYVVPPVPEALPDNVERIRISPGQLCKLSGYIEESFDRTGNGGYPRKIAAGTYGGNDVFYHAIGTYSAYMTCNEWLRRGLAGAGIRAPLWSPFVQPVLYQLQRIKSGTKPTGMT